MFDRVIGVIGELLMTAGVFVLLFVGWHVWFNDIVAGNAQDEAGAEFSELWADTATRDVEFPKIVGTSTSSGHFAEPPVLQSGALTERFATLLVPRFGTHFERAIAEGIDPESVLNVRDAGIGHYPQSQDLGEIGNFALAGHRTTFGAPFGEIDKLRVGDRIYIETQEGWYVYRFRNLEYVWPDDVDVLKPVPEDSVTAQDRILTMTSCHPKLSSAERVVAYSVFDTFVPRENGVPLEVANIKAVG